MKTVQEPTQPHSDIFVFRPYDEGIKGMILLVTVCMIVPPFAIPMVAQNQQPDEEKAIVLMILLEIMMFFIQYLILSYFRVTLIFQSGALRVIGSRRRNDRCIPAETFSYAYITYQYTTRWNYILSSKELSYREVQRLAFFGGGLKPRKASVILIPTNYSRVEEIEAWIYEHVPHIERWDWKGNR